MVSAAKDWAARINRGVRKRNARFRHEADVAFGEHLTIHRFVLGNGLDVLICPEHSAPVASFHTWYRVGSKHEDPKKTGLAHLFEHLMFKETKNNPEGAFDHLLEDVGAESNAATWTDWTQYYENVPAQHLELPVRLEADRMRNVVLNEEQVASEIEVVANERRQRVEDDIEGAAGELLWSRSFQKHGYRWPTIGWMEHILAFNVPDCIEFYRTYYAPNNATLVFAGDVDPVEVLSMVQEFYGSYAAAQIPTRKRKREPNQTRARRATLKKPTANERLFLGFRSPAYTHRDYAKLVIANEVLMGGRSSRLYNRLVVEEELVTEVSGFVAPFAEPGLYEIYANAREGVSAEQVNKVVWSEVRRAAKDGVSNDELERAKNRMELSFLSSMETAAGKADQLGFAHTVAGDCADLFTRLDKYRRVNTGDVRGALATYVKPSASTKVTVLPEGRS